MSRKTVKVILLSESFFLSIERKSKIDGAIQSLNELFERHLQLLKKIIQTIIQKRT